MEECVGEEGVYIDAVEEARGEEGVCLVEEEGLLRGYEGEVEVDEDHGGDEGVGDDGPRLPLFSLGHCLFLGGVTLV